MNWFRSNKSIHTELETIIGDDGYVEWEVLLERVKKPKDIKFLNSKNRLEAQMKLRHVFERIETAFGKGPLDNFDSKLVKDLLKRLCLERAKIQEHLFEKETIREFLNRLEEAISQNEIFLTFVLNFDVYSSNLKYEKYLVDYVTYCFVLEVLTVNLMEDEDFFQECLNSIDAERETGSLTRHWRSYATLFQRAKITTILPFIPDLSPKIIKEYFEEKGVFTTVDDTYSPASRLGLTVNITEAVLEDLNKENYDNAKAGYELALMDGLLDFSKFSNEKRVLVAPTSSMYRYSAFPRNWSDLYNAWNLVFVGNFKEFPYYACKLLFPEVADYQDEPHKYLYPRLLGLWLHIHYVLFEATHGHKREHDLNLSKESLDLLGKITWTYAKAYRKFYDKLNYELSPKWYIPFDYFTDKLMRMFFYALKTGMKSTNNAEKVWIKFRRKLEKYRTKWLA